MARAILHGIAVSTGIAIGKAFFLNHQPDKVPHTLVPLDRVEPEVDRLELALARVAVDFKDARDLLPDGTESHLELLNSHLLICKDPKLRDESVRRVREQRMNAEWALEESIASIAEAFSRIPSPYIRDRMEDVRLVADRILQRLSGGSPPSSTGEERGILLAYDLTPADVVGLSPERVFSFATEQGGQTSHTGILARSLRIPAVVGVSGLSEEATNDDLIIVDGFSGRLFVDPDEAELARYSELQTLSEDYEKRIRRQAAFPAETEDGCRVAVAANVESSAEAEAVLEAGGEGIGLVRTEFGYITRAVLPNEDELYAEYAALVKALTPRRVTFRTLDLGGEKIFSGRKSPMSEANPALGLRAIRYCLRHQDIFRTQLRAILRASAHGNAALMFPLISGLDELRIAKAVLNEAKQELRADNIAYDPDMLVGIMVELPSAVLIADALAREADFFSIGTNDLIQYSLGVDRGNRQVAYLSQALHPAVIRSIKHVVDMAHKEGISVTVCGEMAADLYCLPLLLGMPVDELSLAPQAIPGIKHLIRRSNAENCRALLRHSLSAPTVQSVRTIVREEIYSLFPEDVAFFMSQMDNNV